MTYEAWRISYQSSEQAARAAYAECARLQAKITEMEKQEPVAWMDRHGTLYNSVSHVRPSDKPLFTLPGAQPQLNEIKIALQRALELGAREAWTWTRKHRSWEDQREEQQRWNKVWSLLGAQGEEK